MRRCAFVCFVAVGLAAWQLWLLHGFRDHLDLHPCDGVVYLNSGLAMAEGRLQPHWLAWGPVQAVGYALLHAVGVPVTGAQDVMTVLVAVGSTVALFALLAALVGRRVAWPLAALWAASESVLHDRYDLSPPPTYLLSVALAWGGMAAMLRGRFVLGGAALLLAGLERAELSLTLLVAGAVFAGLARGVARRRAVWLSALALLLLVAQQSDAAVRDRSWLAFRQHYAGAAQEDGKVDALHADFARPDALIASDFPGATSPLSAVVANPGAVLRHCGGNTLRLPRALAGLLPFAGAEGWRLAVAALGVLVVLAAVIAPASRRRLRALLRHRRPELAALSVAGGLAVVIALLLMPRADLLMTVVPPLLVVVGLALRAWLHRPRMRVAGGPARLLSVAVLGALVAAPRPFAAPGGVPRETRAIVRLLQRNPFAPDERVAVRFAMQLVVFGPEAVRLQPVDLALLRARCDDLASGATLLGEALPQSVLVSPGSLAVLGPLGAALAAELSTDRWVIADYFFPVLLYRRAP